MRVFFSLFTLGCTLFLGCTGGDVDKGDGGAGGDGGSSGGDDGGTGNDEHWSPSGEGIGYLVDGALDNSVFHLDIGQANYPRTDESYHGWLSVGGADPLALGEITVTATNFSFETELGLNALVAGYDTFHAFAGTGPDADSTGTALWQGAIDPELKGAYEALLLAKEGTPDGEGSLRTIESMVELLIEHVEEVKGLASVPADFAPWAEGIVNVLEGTEEDLDDDGVVNLLDGLSPILGDAGLVELIKDDLAIASASVEPLHPVKDLANWAYDCTQRIEGFAKQASREANVALVCTSMELCNQQMDETVDNLEWALGGFDTDESGDIDLIDEGTIECALYFASRMAYMDVATVPTP
jgi:hypothetical protein